MSEIHIEWTGYQMAAIENLCNTVEEIGTPMGLELEALVIGEWYAKHCAKIWTGKAPYRFKMKPSTALAMRRMLLKIGLQNLIEDAIRNNIIAEIDRNLPPHCLHLQYGAQLNERHETILGPG